MFDAEEIARVKAVEEIGKAKMKEIRVSGNAEETCIRETYEAEQKAKADAIAEEFRANLKELKQPRVHEEMHCQDVGGRNQCES